MKTILTMLLLALLPLPSLALTAERDEVQRVAENWVKLVIARDGAWGRHESARAGGIQEFRRGDRILGYYCPVDPEGYLILALHREMAPLRFYAGSGSLDIEATDGMTDFLKDSIETFYDDLEEALGHPLRADQDLSSLAVRNYQPLWDELSDPLFEPAPLAGNPPDRGRGMAYQEGDSLLTVTWGQRPPYNHQCRDGGCDWGIPPGHEWFNENVRVGCAGVAIAMIQKYWNWPPYGESTDPFSDQYDWKNMHKKYLWNPDAGSEGEMWVFKNGNWYVASADEINAVAELSFEAAEAVQTNYGCSSSSAYLQDFPSAFADYFWMRDSEIKDTDDYSLTQTWNMLVTEFNYNRPVLWFVTEHFIVADGWRERDVGSEILREVHLVYGWFGESDGWYTIGDFHEGVYGVDQFIRYIAPETIIEANLLSSYGFYPLFPYRYFCYDTEGLASEFLAGNRLQVLRSGFHLKNLVGGGEIRFYGEPDLETYLFLYGNEEDERRIRIYDGELKLVNGGELVIH